MESSGQKLQSADNVFSLREHSFSALSKLEIGKTYLVRFSALDNTVEGQFVAAPIAVDLESTTVTWSNHVQMRAVRCRFTEVLIGRQGGA